MAEDDVDPLEDITKDITEPQVEPAALQRRADEIAEIRKQLEARQQAYRRIFSGGLGDDIKVVMSDMRKFCRGDQSAYDENDRTHCLLTGRQEVWLRIREYMELDLDTLFERRFKPDTE